MSCSLPYGLIALSPFHSRSLPIFLRFDKKSSQSGNPQLTDGAQECGSLPSFIVARSSRELKCVILRLQYMVKIINLWRRFLSDCLIRFKMQKPIPFLC
jgi:hypothetical protein